jgi:DNA-binding NtrC family response regulator
VKRYRFALVVEDDPGVRRALVLDVRRHARKVVGVEDVAGALAALALKPDLITLDLELPDGRGREVLEALRKHSFCPFVIVISGAGSASEAFALRARGVAVYLEKPWARNELSRILVEGPPEPPIRETAARWVGRVPLLSAIDEVRDAMYAEALRLAKSDRSAAGRLLGVKRQTVQPHVHRHGEDDAPDE